MSRRLHKPSSDAPIRLSLTAVVGAAGRVYNLSEMALNAVKQTID